MSSVNNETTVANISSVERITAAAVMFFPSLLSLHIYVIFIYLVLKTKELRENPFFYIATSSVILDCSVFVGMSLYSAPCSLLQSELGGWRLNTLVGSFLNGCLYGYLPLAVSLSINRYVSICHRGRYKDLFSMRRTRLIVAGCYIFGSIWIIIGSLDCCTMLYFPEYYAWWWDFNNYGSTVLSQLDIVQQFSAFIVITIFNVMVFLKYWKMHRQIGGEASTVRQEAVRRECEFKLFLQFFLIWSFRICTGLLFYVAQFLEPSKELNIWVNFMWIQACSVEGYVYIFANGSLRRKAWDVVKGLLTSFPC